MIALDTAAIVDLIRGDQGIREALARAEPIVTTRINYLEVRFGLDTGNARHREELEAYEAFFKDVPILELTPEACQRAAAVRWALKKQGKTVEGFDLAIAGILLVHGITNILTRNERHFENVSGLNVIPY